MDKTAQKRNIFNKLHEFGNVPARSAENFFKPELKRVMDTLITADDVVRSTLSGERIGKAVSEDPVSAKDLLREAKSLVTRREYLSAVANLGRFHKKMQDVVNVLDKLTLNVNSLHHQFLFNKLPTKHREHLEDFEKRIASQRLVYMTKEAGIMDFFHNIGTQRGRALAAWEKRYPEVVGKIRQGTIDQLGSSQELLSEVLNLLKDMATYRAARKIDDYLSAGKQIVAAFKKFDMGGKSGGFRGFYNTTIKPWMDTQRKLESEQATSSTSKAVENMIVDQSKKNLEKPEATDKAVTLPGLGNHPVPGEVMIPPGGPVPSGIEPVPEAPPTPIPTPIQPERMKSDEVAEELFGQKKSSYDAFVDSLEVFSDEDPGLLAAHIAKYAKSIQAEQPEVAVKLFKIAKSLRG